MVFSVAQANDLTATLEDGIVTALQADPWLQPTGQVYESGDASNQLSGWTLDDLSSTNSNDGLLYWNLTNVAATRTVTLYSDSAKSASVAKGSVVGDGAIVLAEQNSSGLTGTVTVAYTVADTDSGNTLSAGLGGIKNVRRRDIDLDDYDVWFADAPLLFVNAMAGDGASERVTLGHRTKLYVVTIEGRLISLDKPLLWNAGKELLDRLETFVYSQAETSGQRFDGVLDDGDGMIQETAPTLIDAEVLDDESGDFTNSVLAVQLEIVIPLTVEVR